ncbi:hypothetical protein [Streptomyces sp. NPDC045470]|uniref:hypothetical protein n=1 Tax=Streptomyces sp. NPDC045470 TaxID=3155469 RepID=UPI0033F2CF3D
MHRSRSRSLAAGAVLALSACGQQRTGSGPSFSPTLSVLTPARGNVEPDSHDGAPHYRENNGFKVPREMTRTVERAGQTA